MRAVPLAVAAAAWSAPALAPVVPPVARALGIPRHSARADTVALTFDDGPHPAGTPAVLDILAAEDVRATFFLVGEQVQRTGTLAAEIVAAGHVVALHGQRHRNLLRLSPAAARRDIDRGAEVIADAAGTPPALHRPPYGIYSPAALHAVRERGLAPVLWSRWGHDWRRGARPGAIAAEVTDRLVGREVLLLHDADDYSAPGSWRLTVAALPRVLEAIAAAGLRPVPIATADDLAHPSGR